MKAEGKPRGLRRVFCFQRRTSDFLVSCALETGNDILATATYGSDDLTELWYMKHGWEIKGGPGERCAET